MGDGQPFDTDGIAASSSGQWSDGDSVPLSSASKELALEPLPRRRNRLLLSVAGSMAMGSRIPCPTPP